MMQRSDDWRGQHLIRCQNPRSKQDEVVQAEQNALKPFQLKALKARQELADKIRPLAPDHTNAQIAEKLGMHRSRLSEICREFGIKMKMPPNMVKGSKRSIV